MVAVWKRVVVAGLTVLAGATLGAVAPASAEDLLDTIKQSHELTVGTSDDAPLSYIDSKTHEGKGVLIDVLKEVLRREGVETKVTVVAMPFASLIPSVQSGRIQLMGDAMYIRPARKQLMDFTDGIFYNPESLDVKKGNPLGLHKLSDACGHAAGTYQGTVYVDMLEKVAAACPSGAALDVHTYPTIQNVFADLAAGRIDAAVVDSSLSAYALVQTPSLGFELVSDYVPEAKADTLCAFAVSKGTNDKFVAAFNKHFKDMLADGTAAKLFEASGLTPTDFFLKS